MNITLLNCVFSLEEQYIGESVPEIRQQLEEYAQGRRTTFALIIHWDTLPNTHILTAIATIPYGHTATYSTIAAQTETHPRAVGIACRKNPLPLCIPCHRVIGAHGIGGYGYGVAVKRQLLAQEADRG